MRWTSPSRSHILFPLLPSEIKQLSIILLLCSAQFSQSALYILKLSSIIPTPIPWCDVFPTLQLLHWNIHLVPALIQVSRLTGETIVQGVWVWVHTHILTFTLLCTSVTQNSNVGGYLFARKVFLCSLLAFLKRYSLNTLEEKVLLWLLF